MTLTASPDAVSSDAPADSDRRFYAFVLDRLVSWGVVALAGVPAYQLLEEGRPWQVVGVVVAAWLLVGLANAVVLGLRGTSVGRAALGLRLVDHDSGEPIGVGPALLRTLLLGAGTLPTFGFGTASLAWTALADPVRRGWHDHVTGSVVVDVRPPVVAEEPVEERPRHIVNLTTARLAAAPAQDPPHDPVQGTPAQGSPNRASPVPTSATPATAVQGRHVGEPAALGSPLRSPTGAGPGGGARWVSFDTGESFAVEGRTLLGRRPEPREGEAVSRLVRLVSTDMSVSKTHAQLDLAPEGVLVVTDRGSTNGSVLVRDGVSRELPAGRPATLLPGDLVRFGDRQMVVDGDA